MARMRLILGVLVCGLLFTARGASASPSDTTADAVLGQPGLNTNGINAGGVSASSLQEPRGLALNTQSPRLFVADSGNNRVLSWPNPAAFSNNQAADVILGQPNAVSILENVGSLTPSAKTMANPRSVAVDSAGRLYVADSGNKRVLRFDPPFSTNQAAVQVFGQNGDFTKNDQATQLNPTADNLGNPDGIAVDTQDNLYIADRFLHRVSIYLAPATSNNTTADLVIGQPNLTSAALNQNAPLPAANTLAMPIAVGLDSANNLYVADEGNNRVLLFLAPLSNNKNAVRVYGQPNFSQSISNNPTRSATTLSGPVGVAIDPATGNLFVADALNNRILEYTDPQNDSTADRVFGQFDAFTTGTVNLGGVSAGSLSDVAGVVLGTSGTLYASDRLNQRVLRYNAAPVADLAVAIADAPDPVGVGDDLVYTISITNNGPSFAQAVTLSDPIPAGATFSGTDTAAGTCTGTTTITCNLGDLASGSGVIVKLTVKPTATGTLDNTVTVATTSNDNVSGNNSAETLTTVNESGNGNNGGSSGGSGKGFLGCAGPSGLMGAGGAGLLPLALIGLGGMKWRGHRRRN
jgi:uncharacterized repeat protein (TIGR01451 family)